MKRMKNVCVPMVTPMYENGEVDYDSLASLTKHLIERGVYALYPCGTTGEVANLSVEERIKITETVVKAAEGKVSVFAQIGGRTTKETLELAEAAVEAGADGLGLLTPTYYVLSDEELFDYYKTISEAVPEDMPIYMYGIPGLAANRLSVSLVERIAQACPNIRGIKYSVADILTLMAFHRIRDNTFDVLVAPVQMMLPALAGGMCGTVSGNCNVFPEVLNEMMTLFEQGRIKECQKLQDHIAELAGATGAKEAAKCKALLARIGVIACDAVRLPQTQLSAEEKEAFFSWVDEHYTAYSYKPE